MTISQTNIEPIAEVRTALVMVSDFFEAGTLKEHLKDLKKWRYHVINDQQYSSRHDARHVLAVYEESKKMIDVAWILFLHRDLLRPITITAGDEPLETNKEYLRLKLSGKELLNPVKAIKRFFKYLSAEDHQELLHEWLSMALSNKILVEMLSPKQIIDTYDNLRKLYSAVWIIHQRKKNLIE